MTARCALGTGALMSLSASVWADTPMSYLHTFGPAADPATRLGWGLGIVSLAVMVIIGLLLLGGIFRRRPRPESADQLAVHRDSGGMGWIYIGVGISAVVLIIFMGWTLVVLAAVVKPATRPALTVEVTAYQWWWGLRYRADDTARIFITANEIHIPAGQPVRFELASADVIHSFWVPQLAGKTDLIPGLTNVAWLQADHPGIYRGQCGEYCGAQHAHMALAIIADTPQDFSAWWDKQLQDAPAPVSGASQRGHAVFAARCAACHAVRGTKAGGLVGPDLTHLMSRHTLAAGLLPNTPGNLAAWIADAQALKPGSRMPSLTLSGSELTAVMAYLNTLQ